MTARMTRADGGAAHNLAKHAFRAECICAGDLIPHTQVVAIDSFLRALDRLAAVTVSDGLETETAAPGTGEKLLTIAREFIDKHHVSCAEATANDGVYEEAPLLVEALAEVAGYYSYPGDDQ